MFLLIKHRHDNFPQQHVIRISGGTCGSKFSIVNCMYTEPTHYMSTAETQAAAENPVDAVKSEGWTRTKASRSSHLNVRTWCVCVGVKPRAFSISIT